MITSHIVDRATFEKARANHLGLLRLTFDRANSQNDQYDICSMAREFYGDEQAVIQMEDDLKYSKKPKF